MDAEDVAQIAESLRQALEADPAKAAAALDEFGWRELLEDQPHVAVSTLFALTGELLTDGSQLDAVLLHAGGFGTGDVELRVVLPRPGTSDPAGRLDADGVLNIDGVAQRGTGPLLVAVSGAAGNVSFARCDVLEPLPGEPLDDTAGWVRIRTSAPYTDVDGAPDSWERMVAAGRRALAHELIGVAGRMASMTVEHVSDRVQFGQTLSRFQAVKHQLADVHLWHEAAALSVEAAWEAGDAASAALAKSAALRFSRSARAVCQQLLGGMGFTWEHDFHRYLRRALTIEPLLGATAALHVELGAALRAGAISDEFAAL